MPFTTHSLYKLERLRDTSSHRPRAQASSVQLSSHKGLGQCDWLCAVRLREAGVVGLISKGGVTKPKLNPHIFLNNPHRGDGSVCLASRKLRCCFGGGGGGTPIQRPRSSSHRVFPSLLPSLPLLCLLGFGPLEEKTNKSMSSVPFIGDQPVIRASAAVSPRRCRLICLSLPKTRLCGPVDGLHACH